MKSTDANQKQHHSFRGSVTPENLVFHANLQEFSQKVGYICAFYTGGKISADKAHEQISQLWQQLKKSKVAINP
ncbi:DUF7219 family protein [Lusitaniella coriacea]|uniref:DUF7219 family protein n=1 Tax=Lusitaniella coriacea TaxID=1983105 RepID=UPI003CFA674F